MDNSGILASGVSICNVFLALGAAPPPHGVGCPIDSGTAEGRSIAHGRRDAPLGPLSSDCPEVPVPEFDDEKRPPSEGFKLASVCHIALQVHCTACLCAFRRSRRLSFLLIMN